MNIIRRLDWYIWDFIHIVISVVTTVVIFFGGIFYGDAPVDMKFTCEVPSQVYEYEAGDTVELSVTSKNVGRPFMGKIDPNYPTIDITVYLNADEEKKIYYFEPSDEIMDGYWEEFIMTGHIDKKTCTFTIPEDAPKGEYNVSVSQFGDREVFEGLITVK